MEINWPTGLSTEKFVKDYWQQKPLLMPNAFPDFECPFDPDEFCGLTMDEDFASRLIRLNGEKKWTVKHGPFEEEELTSLPTTDWSILITDMEKTLPDFREFLEPFKFIPSWRIDDLMMSYAPKGASVGAHTDAYDVFLFQASGQREWSITEDPDADLTYIPDQEIRILANFKAQSTWVLNPGDMLYLPPGVPHHGVSMDNECMTWSVGFRAPTHVDVVSDIALSLESHIKEDLRYSDPSFNLQNNSGEISPETIKRFRAIWDSYMNPTDEDFARMIGESLTRPSSEPEELEDLISAEDDLSEVLAESETWEISAQARLAYSTLVDNKKANLFVNGVAHECSLEMARLLTDNISVSPPELEQLVLNNDDATIVRVLINNGTILSE